jgi:hypothetical protein
MTKASLAFFHRLTLVLPIAMILLWTMIRIETALEATSGSDTLGQLFPRRAAFVIKDRLTKAHF